MSILKSFLAAGLLAAPLASHAALTESASHTVNLAIPDDGETGTGDIIQFTSAIHGIVPNATWSRLAVQLQIAGGYNGDLYALLEHGSDFAVLINRPGRTASADAGYGDSGFNVIFDDTALNGDIHQYRSKQNPVGGTLNGLWQPDGRDVDPVDCVSTDPRTATLADLVSGSPDGDWSLTLIDSVPGDQATLVSWGLTFGYTTPPEIAVHNGSTTAAPGLTSGQATAVDFGTTALLVPVGRDFTIENSGHDSLNVSGVTVPPGYLALGLPALPFTVPAQGSITFSVILTAASGGSPGGNVVVASNDADEAAFSFPITAVVDGNAPTISTCAADRTLLTTGNAGVALADLRGELTAADLEPGTLTVVQSPAPGTVLLAGDTVVAFEVSDAAGNKAACQCTVSVVRQPVARPDFGETIADVPTAFVASKLLGNDSDPDGSGLALTAVSPASSQGGTAVLNAGIITYTPPAAFTGTDTFTYTLSAGGRTANGTVTVRVRASDLVPSNAVYLRAATSPATGMELRFAGLPGRQYSVQFTQNLSAGWTELARVTAQSPSGFIDYAHTTAPPGLGFYRCLPAQ